MKITVNKAKIKKLASFAEKSDSIGTKALFFCAGNVWAAKGGALISTPYNTEPGEEVKTPFSVEIEKLKKVIDKAPEVKKGEIQIDFSEIETTPLHNKGIGYLERMTNAETVAEIDRMFYALIAPKSRSESVNIMVTDKQVKAELIDHYKFVGGCEIEQKNELAAPLLFYLSDDFIFPLSKKQSEKYSIVRESDYQYKEDEGYYLKYESTNGTTYQALHYKGEKAKFYSDEIKNAFKLAIEQMKEQSELATEPEPTTIEPVKPTESEESKMQEKKEIEPTEPTMEKPAAEPIQNEEIQTPEPTAATAAESQPEPTNEKEGGCAPGWTGKSDYQERREAKIERREERAAELRREAEKLRESIPTDYAYWTQPAHTYSAAGRAFERQRERERGKYDKIYKMERRAEYLENHTESTAISSDDPEALDKLRAKLQALKENHEKLKAENKRRRQAGEEQFPWYTLQYSNRDIKRIEERIKELETRQNTTWKKYKFDGGEIIPNVEENRYQIFHDEKPEQDIIDALKAAGWRWSKYYRCWQRMLNRATVSAIETSGKWGRIDYLPGLHEAGAESEPEEPAREPEQTTEPEPAAMQEGAEVVEPVENQEPEAAPVEITEEKQEQEPERIPAIINSTIEEKIINRWGCLLIIDDTRTGKKAAKGNIYGTVKTFRTRNEVSTEICEKVRLHTGKPYALQGELLRLIPNKIKVEKNAPWQYYIATVFYSVEPAEGDFNDQKERYVKATFQVFENGNIYCQDYIVIRDGGEFKTIDRDILPPNSKPQPKQTQPIEKEEQEKMQDEKTNEPEPTEAGVLPMTDQLKLWGLPLDWERVQVIKHNAQESGLALMVYNVDGDGALFAMLPGFWAIVKERSKFDENSGRFIRDNYDGVICYFDKDPEQAGMQEEPKAANPPIYTESVKWMEDAKTVSIPAPAVACKVDAPVQIPEPEPKPTDEEPDPEQIDKSKPTGAELRYSLSLLAMPYPIDTLIEKFLKKTNKPVRYSIVEKLLMTIDRGSVPKPGESKREYIKTYYQTH